MPIIKCPVCWIHQGNLDVVAIALHLIDVHNWQYEETQDWMRQQEESCA